MGAHYGATLGKKRKDKAGDEKDAAPVQRSSSVQKKIAARQAEKIIDPNINSQFDTGRLLACISSGRASAAGAMATSSRARSSSSMSRRWRVRRSRHTPLQLPPQRAHLVVDVS